MTEWENIINMKKSNKKLHLTKKNLLLWNLDIFIECFLAIAGIVYSLVIVVVIAKLLRHDSFLSIFDFNLLMLFLLPIGIIFFVGVLDAIKLQQCMDWVYQEEVHLGIQFEDTLGKVSIPKTAICYTTEDWFVVPCKTYAFHIDFINNMSKFKYRSSYPCGYNGKLYTANGDTWKIFMSNSEYRKLKIWFKQGKDKNKKELFNN